MAIPKAFQDSIQFVDYQQPVSDLAYVGSAVLCYWDGTDVQSVKCISIEARIPYRDGFPPNSTKLTCLRIAKDKLINEYNPLFLEGMKPYHLSDLLSEQTIENLYRSNREQ